MRFLPSLPRFYQGLATRSPLLNKTNVHKTIITASISRFQSTAVAEPVNDRPFDKVLVANRGEIVERVIRTCRDLDIATVAVYSTADSKARFVRQADESICIGPAAATDSYLNVEAVLDAVQQSGAQAVHPGMFGGMIVEVGAHRISPLGSFCCFRCSFVYCCGLDWVIGYGFLSENADFSRDVSKQAVFLGPTADAIHQLGDKIESKSLAIRAGVDVVPGYDGVVETLEQARQICHETLSGYPVLLKAAAGGGGKGMRICWSDQDLKEAWNVAKAEAIKFFKDDRLLVEKYIERPHHIEFQVVS